MHSNAAEAQNATIPGIAYERLLTDGGLSLYEGVRGSRSQRRRLRHLAINRACAASGPDEAGNIFRIRGQDHRGSSGKRREGDIRVDNLVRSINSQETADGLSVAKPQRDDRIRRLQQGRRAVTGRLSPNFGDDRRRHQNDRASERREFDVGCEFWTVPFRRYEGARIKHEGPHCINLEIRSISAGSTGPETASISSTRRCRFMRSISRRIA